MAKELRYGEKVYTKDDVKVVKGITLPRKDEPFRYLYKICPVKGHTLQYFHYKMKDIDFPVEMSGIPIDYFDEEGE